MKVLIAFLCCSLFAFGQDQDQTLYGNYVECYYSKATKNPIRVYDAVNGKVVDVLNNIDDKNSWYKLAIAESVYGWFKIKNIKRLPSSQQDYNYENYWVKSTDFLVEVDNYDDNYQVYIYDMPTRASNKIHKLNNDQEVTITEVSDLWAKIKFKVGKKEIEGWLSYKDQCGYPWTTCPKYE